MTLSIYGNWLKQSSSSFVLCLGSESKFSKAGSQEGKVMLSWAEDEIGGAHEDELKLLSLLYTFDFHVIMHLPTEARALQETKHTDLAQESDRLNEDPGKVEQLQVWPLPTS